jgi:hypothetical protein
MSVLGAIPSTYTQQTSNSKSFFIQKGQLNYYRIRPEILNEHVDSSRVSQAVVDSSTIVGQVFRASQDNINSINLTMESAAGVTFDNFESYANDAALQVAWVETDTNDKATIGSEVPVDGGSQSMCMPADATAGDEWVNTISATDYTSYTFEFPFYQNRDYSQVKFSLFVGDGTNTKSQPIVVQSASAWEPITINVDDMAEDGGGTTDAANITKIGFRLDTRRNSSTAYVDNIVLIPEPGSVSVELWDMGIEKPVSGINSIDDGTQYTELGDRGINSGAVSSSVTLQLVGGKRKYHLEAFVAGVALEIPSNTLLNVGNFYAIVIKYIDTDVKIYGGDASFLRQYYPSGYAFTAPDSSTAITALGEFNHLQFQVFSTQDCYLNTLVKSYDGTPGNNSSEVVLIEDKDMHNTGIVIGDHKPKPALIAEFKDRVFHFPKGGKMEVNHSDDITDDTTQITIVMGYIFKPEPNYIHGDLE